MIPLWRARSGTFAGWHTNDLLYDADGHHVGYLAGHLAYLLDGTAVGEIHQGEWIGARRNAQYPRGERQEQRDAVAHARLPNRDGLALDEWQDPAM